MVGLRTYQHPCIPPATSTKCCPLMPRASFERALTLRSTCNTPTFQNSHILTFCCFSFSCLSVCLSPQLAVPAYTATCYKFAVARSKTRHQLGFTEDSRHFRECCAIHINLQVINHSLFQTRHMVKLRRVGHASKLLYCAVENTRNFDSRPIRPNKYVLRVISGFRGDINELFALLECYTVGSVVSYRSFGTTYPSHLQKSGLTLEHATDTGDYRPTLR